jgi:hypothetical protein
MYHRHDIVVSKRSMGLSVTYRRQGRILETIEPLRIDPRAQELNFLVRAWKAAFAKRNRSAGSTDSRMRPERIGVSGQEFRTALAVQ